MPGITRWASSVVAVTMSWISAVNDSHRVSENLVLDDSPALLMSTSMGKPILSA
jgi:hypothetical protein